MKKLRDAPIPKSGFYQFVADMLPLEKDKVHDKLYNELIETLDIVYKLAESVDGQVLLPANGQQDLLTDAKRAELVCDAIARNYNILENRILRQDLEKEILLGFIQLRNDLSR